MGFSTSAVVVIFTASVMYMASMFYPLAEMSYNNVQEANKYSNELWKEKLNTKIVISNRVGNDLTIYNDGTTTLDSSKINVIINGEFKPILSVSPSGIWSPKTSINVNIGTANGRVKIVTANGAADYSVT